MPTFFGILLFTAICQFVAGVVLPRRARAGEPRPGRMGVVAIRGIWLAAVLGFIMYRSPETLSQPFPWLTPQAGEVAPQSFRSKAPAPPRGLVVAYREVGDPLLAEWQEYARNQQMLERFADRTNEWVQLPGPVTLTFRECGQANAFYRPRTRTIEMCLEKLARDGEIFRRRLAEEWVAEGIQGATFFILAHEVGHALVHTLGLPVTGREEDAVDQLATLMMLNGSREGRRAALAWAMTMKGSGYSQWSLADEHSLDEQRRYNILCWMYGADPARNVSLVRKGHLPERRARRCPAEFQQMRRSWTMLLGPNLRTQTFGAAHGN